MHAATLRLGEPSEQEMRWPLPRVNSKTSPPGASATLTSSWSGLGLRPQFFNDDDQRPIKYWEGAGDVVSRQHRFVGWFMFDVRLPDDRAPAQLAAETLFAGAELLDALDAIRRTRFVLAIVRSTDGKRTTLLELEDERFEVRNGTWSQELIRGSAIVAHLVPVRNRYWLAGPGWLHGRSASGRTCAAT